MEGPALSLFVGALKVAASLTFPVIAVVAAIGVIVGLVQTIVQVQDQNVSFGPKLAAVGILIAAGGPGALVALRTLLLATIDALPHLARA